MMEKETKGETGTPTTTGQFRGVIGVIPPLEVLENALETIKSSLLPLAISHHLDPKDKDSKQHSRRHSVGSNGEVSSTNGTTIPPTSNTQNIEETDFQQSLAMSLAAAKARRKALASMLVTAFRIVKEEVNRLNNPNDKRLKIVYFFRYLIVCEFLTGETSFSESKKSFIGKTIKEAIKKGAPSYNTGKYKECFEIYKAGAQLLLSPTHSHECHELCKRDECLHELHPLLVEIKTALDIVDRTEKDDDGMELGFSLKADDWDTRAWILRRGFDFLLFNKLV